MEKRNTRMTLCLWLLVHTVYYVLERSWWLFSLRASMGHFSSCFTCNRVWFTVQGFTKQADAKKFRFWFFISSCVCTVFVCSQYVHFLLSLASWSSSVLWGQERGCSWGLQVKVLIPTRGRCMKTFSAFFSVKSRNVYLKLSPGNYRWIRNC